MNIAIIEPFISAKGGSERTILQIAKRFSAPIYTFDCNFKSTFPEFSELDVRKIKPSRTLSSISELGRADPDSRLKMFASAGLNLLNFKPEEEFDVLNPHMTPSHWIANRNQRVCWYCQSPLRAAYDMHDYLLGERKPLQKPVFYLTQSVYRAIDRAMVPKISVICVNSKNVDMRMEKYLSRKNSHIIHPGVDMSDFECTDYRRFFLCFSRFVPEKRFEMAINAFKFFINGRGVGNWRLVLAGDLDPSVRNLHYVEKLKREAKGAPISFVFSPSDSRVKKLYASCFATLFCAINEDWGLTPLEGMASSKPCISVKEGGPLESISDGKTGFLVTNEGEMAEKMRFLADRPEVCEQMGKAGRKRVLQNYTWKIFLDKIEKVFKQTAKM